MTAEGLHRRSGRAVIAVALIVAGLLGAASSAHAAGAPRARAGAGGPQWNVPHRLDPGAGFAAVSCPTVTFCMVVDELGHAAVFRHGHWSSPVVADPHLGALHAVSCPSTSLCVAVDQAGRVVRWDGTHWSVPVEVDPHGFEAIECPTTSFCAAADFAGRVLTWDGGQWSRPFTVESGGQGFSTLSCPQASGCVAMTTDGFFTSWNGKRWSKPADENTASAGISVSLVCVTTKYCMAALSNGDAAVDTGATLHPVLVDHSGTGFSSLSCPTTTFCVGVDREGDAFAWDGSRWSGATPVDRSAGVLGLTSVSCPVAGHCVAVSSSGDVVSTRS